MKYELSEGELMSEAVVLAVAAAEDCEPTTLAPLTDTIDPDGVESLFTLADGTPRDTVSLSFIYSDSRVIIRNLESIEVEPMSEA